MEAEQLFDILVKFHLPSTAGLAEHLDSVRMPFWDVLDLTSRCPELQTQ